MSKYRKLTKIPGYTRELVVSFMREKLRSDKQYILKALTILYNRQTEYEKSKMKTSIENNIGFTSSHAPRLMYIYKYVIKKGLTPDNIQVRYLKDTIWHYAEQLVELSDPDKLLVALNDYYKNVKPVSKIEDTL